MTTPVRIQLSRAKGFDLQAHSRSINGLPAMNVARPGRWGNPYRVTDQMPASEAVEAHRDMWADMLKGRPDHARRELAKLAGHNLACWCRPGQPCHADTLLNLVRKCEEDANA